MLYLPYPPVIEEFIAEQQLNAALTIDRFHVAQHYHEGFDKLRQQELKRLKQEWGAEKYQEIGQGMM